MYRNLLETLSTALLDEEDRTDCLVLVSDPMPPDYGDGGRQASGNFGFPKSMFPEDVPVLQLPNDQNFIESAVAAVREHKPKALFAIPPWTPFKKDQDAIGVRAKAAKEWNQINGSLEIYQVFLETILETKGGIQPEVQFSTVLMPSDTRRNHGGWASKFFPAHSALVVEHDHECSGLGVGFPVDPSYKLSTLAFRRERGPVRFFKVSKDMVDQPEVLQDLSRLLRQDGGTTEYGYVYRDDLTAKDPTTFDFYSPETDRLRQSVNDLSPTVSLGKIAKILIGSDQLFRGFTTTDCGGPLIVTGTVMTHEGTFVFPEKKGFVHKEYAGEFELMQNGDICVGRHIDFMRVPLTVAVYDASTEKQDYTFDDNVIVIRPNPPLEPEQTHVLLNYLRSEVAKQLLEAEGCSYNLTVDFLKNFPVPFADKELSSAISDIEEARDGFLDWASQLDKERSTIISTSDLAETRLNILTAGQVARQRFRAGRQVEDLDYIVRTQYPLPLAYIWRNWKVSDPNQGLYLELKNILMAGEGFGCFMATVAILTANKCNIKVNYLNSMAKRLGGSGKRGTNFGDWYTILKQVADNKSFRNIPDAVPFFEAVVMMRSNELQEAFRAIKKTRNDDGHLRVNPNTITKEYLNPLRNALEVCYDQVKFVADYKLIQVNDVRNDTIRGVTRYGYSDLTGDNPLVTKRESSSESGDLEKNSLYLRDRQGELHLCRPFLQYLKCPECGLMSTFYLDSYPGQEDEVALKSFERNSTRTEKNADEFKWAGLLPSSDDTNDNPCQGD
jgi:hypothetical protein